MVKTLLFASLMTFGLQKCFGQKKDMVFGKVSKEEIIEGIKFQDSIGNVIRIDNVNSGEPFLLVVSDQKINNIDDFRKPTFFLVDRETLDVIMNYLKENDSKLKTRPKGYGTYRIVFQLNNTIDLYFVPGMGKSFEYFKGLSNVIPRTSDENKGLITWLDEIASQTKPIGKK